MPLKQLLTKPEAELDGLASGRKITKFRVIDDAGASINASAEQIATTISPSLGIDYSLLTEQAVPGEYYIDINGNKKQVYARTFVDTFPTTMPDYKTFEFPSPTPAPTGLMQGFGRVTLGGNTWQMASDVFIFTAYNKLALNMSGKEDWIGAKYTITLKYTK